MHLDKLEKLLDVRKTSFGQNKHDKKCPLFSFVSSNLPQFKF